MSIEDLWRLYTCSDPVFIELVDMTVRRKKQTVEEAPNG